MDEKFVEIIYCDNCAEPLKTRPMRCSNCCLGRYCSYICLISDGDHICGVDPLANNKFIDDITSWTPVRRFVASLVYHWMKESPRCVLKLCIQSSDSTINPQINCTRADNCQLDSFIPGYPHIISHFASPTTSHIRARTYDLDDTGYYADVIDKIPREFTMIVSEVVGVVTFDNTTIAI